jgi:ubiquinone/menaquinone biosynthesis C-methylase UbiE
MDFDKRKIQESYDRIAEEYAHAYYGELAHKILDRQFLDQLAELTKNLGVVCDMGCGPGQIARYLKDQGVDSLGIDLSIAMVTKARQLNPDIPFQQGDMSALRIADNSWGGIAAFYSIIHIARQKVIDVFKEFCRVLSPGGWLLVCFHIGNDDLHVGELYGKELWLDFTFFQTDEVVKYLKAAGFKVKETIERDPYIGFEYESRRGYIFAQKRNKETSSEF